MRTRKDTAVAAGSDAGGDLELGAEIDIASLDLTARLHYCLPQSVTAATAAVVALLQSILEEERHGPQTARRRQLLQYRELGVVLQVTSLLSVAGTEVGMIEDAMVSVEALKHLRFRFETSASDKASPHRTRCYYRPDGCIDVC